MKTNTIIAELARIANDGGGILQPTAVVEAARPITSPLHSRFEWDDNKASHEYRLYQARQLIRVCVAVIGNSPNVNGDRVWVSLKTDRIMEGGGYRPLVTVMSDKTLRLQLLEEAVQEFQHFQTKYGQLTELSNVFAAMDSVSIRQPRKRSRHTEESRVVAQV